MLNLGQQSGDLASYRWGDVLPKPAPSARRRGGRVTPVLVRLSALLFRLSQLFLLVSEKMVREPGGLSILPPCSPLLISPPVVVGLKFPCCEIYSAARQARTEGRRPDAIDVFALHTGLEITIDERHPLEVRFVRGLARRRFCAVGRESVRSCRLVELLLVAAALEDWILLLVGDEALGVQRSP